MASSNCAMLQKTWNNIHSDECYTPFEAIEPILEYLNKSKVYYECSSWISSNIIDYLRDNWYNIISSWDRDFLEDDIPEWIDIILTNPPYSKKDKFIERCYELGYPFALLLPVSSIQWKKRGELFSKYWIEIGVLNKRIDFTNKWSPHFWVAWFCKNILPSKLLFFNNR